jgi:major membrane immunogen (membrane-anchored lipoprotein)
MRRFISSAAVLVAVLLLSACGSRELLSKASFAPDTISPNGDGVQDATSIHYELGRKASVSIYLQDAAGQRYYFRDKQPRAPGAYDVLFGGVIDGQLVPDGAYTWMIEATDEAGQDQAARGQFTVKDGDKTPPEITKFTINPQEITPNQDSISDRAQINVYVNKPANLFVSLQNALCQGSDNPPANNPTLVCAPFPLSEKEGSLRKSGEPGLHEFDYDAGVDLGAEPPPDGNYVVTARLEDAIGQVAVATNTLTIQEGGIPMAEIADGTVNFSRSSLLVGDTLYFTLTVENYGSVPIRTSGPEPGYVYNLDQNYNVPGFAEESGAWRVGIDFDTSERNYPFRWAVGGPGDLITQTIGGKTYYYLPANTKAVVTGGIKITKKPPRDPLYFWAGLIHEDVEISAINNQVDPHFITIDQP